MLIIKDLSWGNCFSYGSENHLSLDENIITQLIGENGSGKSSIALIIQEALFNKNSKNIKKSEIVNRNSDEEGYWIELNFTYNTREYKIRLDRKTTLKVKFLEDDVDISSHTATDTFKSIEGILGIDFKIFVQLIYQSTTDGLSFLTATDTNRKKFLIELFGLNEYDTYHVLFKELISESNTHLAKISGNIDSLTNWIRKNETLPEKLSIVDVPPLPSEDELWELQDKAKRIKEINLKINTNNKFIEMLKDIKFDSEMASKALSPTNLLEQAYGGADAEAKSIGTFLNKISTLKDVCPTCEQPIDKDLQSKIILENQDKLKEVVNSKEANAKLLGEVKLANKDIQTHKQAKAEWENIYTKIDRNLSKNVENINDIVSRIQELDSYIATAKKAYNKALEDNEAANKLNSRITVILEQLDEHRAELEKMTTRLRDATNELSILEILKKAFSTNGLVAYKLENLVKDLEKLANVYLAELSDGRFTLIFSISADKLNVSLTDNGAEIEVAALSSGELARVNTATLLAIRKLMNSISKTQINILFLDEVINVLDEFGRDRLVEVLLEEKGLNTFLVSHGWSHPLLAKVVVSKTEGISELNNG